MLQACLQLPYSCVVEYVKSCHAAHVWVLNAEIKMYKALENHSCCASCDLKLCGVVGSVNAIFKVLCFHWHCQSLVHILNCECFYSTGVKICGNIYSGTQCQTSVWQFSHPQFILCLSKPTKSVCLLPSGILDASWYLISSITAYDLESLGCFLNRKKLKSTFVLSHNGNTEGKISVLMAKRILVRLAVCIPFSS